MAGMRRNRYLLAVLAVAAAIGLAQFQGQGEFFTHPNGQAAVETYELIKTHYLKKLCLLYTSPSPRD